MQNIPNYNTNADYTYHGGSVTNVLSTRQITVSKTVAGNMGDRTKAFGFTLTLQDGNGSPYSGQAAYSATDQDGVVTNGTATFTAGTATFQLKHGESITFLDLPGGLQFTVTEDAQDAGGYQTTTTVNDGSAVNGRVCTGTLAVNPVVLVRNTRQSVVPSGVTDSGHVAWFLLPLFGVGALLWKRKRRLEELDASE